MASALVTADRAGWGVGQYCEACDFSRATYYNLPEDKRPKSLKIGKRRIIIEPPREFLARLAAEQEAA